MGHVPTLGAREAAGAPYEYLHWPQASQLSTKPRFSRVQNLQVHVFAAGVEDSTGSASLIVLHAPQASAKGCNQ